MTSNSVHGAVLTKLVHAIRSNFQRVADNVCTATATLTKIVPPMRPAPMQSQSIAITFMIRALSSIVANNMVWCRRVWTKSVPTTMNSACKITAVAFYAMKIIAIGRNQRNRRHAVDSMSCMRPQCSPLPLSVLCALPNGEHSKFRRTRNEQLLLFLFLFINILTRCAYAKCHVTLIAEPAMNDVRVNPKCQKTK